MRIVFISHYFFPEGNAPATRVHEMTRRWARAGHDVTVITTAPSVPSGVVYDGYRNRWRETETVDGVAVIRVWTYLAANKGTVKRIASFVSFMLTAVLAALGGKKPDLIIATSPQFFCGWAGRIACWIRRTPFVLEIRDLWPESIVAVGAIRNRLIIRFLERLEKSLYRSATKLVTVGIGYRDQLVMRGVDPDNISVIPNGVDLNLFDGNADGARIRTEFDLGDRFVCSYVGTIGMASGLGVVIEAAVLLKNAGRNDFRFLLVGDGAIRHSLEERIAEKHLRDLITVTGQLPKDRMPEVLAATDACLIHLKKSIFFKTVIPSKIFEAGAMSKPIILGVEGLAATLVGDADSGLCIAPDDPVALVKAIGILASDPSLCSRLGSNGKRFVHRDHNYELLANSYLSSLTDL